MSLLPPKHLPESWKASHQFDNQTASSAPAPRTHTDDILRVCTYHRADFDLAVVWFAAREHAAVKESMSSHFRDPTASLGELERLPLELINAICLELDIASLFAFRQVNLRARQIVTVLPEYRLLATYALNCLCALLRTKSASWVTLSDFQRLLCHQSCSLCGSMYGDLVHLINWIRCCSACIRRRPQQTRTMTAASAKRVFQLSNISMKGIRTLRSLPGKYSMEETSRKRRINIVSAQSALSAFRREGSGAELSMDKVAEQPYLDFMACCALPYYDLECKRVQNGVSCAGCQLEVEENTNSDELAANLRDMVYSQESFLGHFQLCKQAQLLWQSSDGGKIEPAKMPYGCKRGGYFNPRQ